MLAAYRTGWGLLGLVAVTAGCILTARAAEEEWHLVEKTTNGIVIAIVRHGDGVVVGNLQRGLSTYALLGDDSLQRTDRLVIPGGVLDVASVGDRLVAIGGPYNTPHLVSTNPLRVLQELEDLRFCTSVTFDEDLVLLSSHQGVHVLRYDGVSSLSYVTTWSVAGRGRDISGAGGRVALVSCEDGGPLQVDVFSVSPAESTWEHVRSVARPETDRMSAALVGDSLLVNDGKWIEMVLPSGEVEQLWRCPPQAAGSGIRIVEDGAVLCVLGIRGVATFRLSDPGRDVVHYQPPRGVEAREAVILGDLIIVTGGLSGIWAIPQRTGG